MALVRISDQLDKRLTHLSQSTHRTKTYYVKEALESFLENHEEYLLAEQAYEEYLASGKKVSSFEEVMDKNGL